MLNKLWPAVALSAAIVLGAACGGDDGGFSETPGPGVSATVAATGSPGPAARPRPSGGPVTPPLEGPARPNAATTRTNYRELADYALPSPQDVPEPPRDAAGAEFHPPSEPKCPEGWEILRRPIEGFQICYPKEWAIDGHGYVSAAAEDRWYSVGFFLRREGVEVAHVSVYVVDPFAMPFTHTRDCKKAYRVTFAGEQAVLCPDHTGVPPEVKIVTYHIRRGDLDYYVNVVPQFTYDSGAGQYLDQWDKEAEATAIQVAQTFQLTPILSPQ